MSLKQKLKKIKWGIGLILLGFLIFDILRIGYYWPKFDNDMVFEGYNLVKYQSKSPSLLVFGEIIASKNGTKYYFKNCSGSNRIKPENIINFESEDDAIRAGYTLAKNCKKP